MSQYYKDRTDTPKTKADVIIVGAGPVGLLTALGLGKAGLDVLVIEAHHELLATTRAMVYMPVVLPVLKELGLLETVLKEAFLNKEGIVWRDLDGTVLARLPLDNDNSDDFEGVLIIGQWRMNELILKELQKHPTVDVQFAKRCVGIEDKPECDTVKLMVHSGSLLDDDTFLEAKYVIATDGANSSVRRMLCVPFEGFTFQEFRMIGTDVIYDFTGQEDFNPLNFVVHEKDWAVIAYTGQGEDGTPRSLDKPQWRVAYVEDSGLPVEDQDCMKRAEKQMEKYIRKGHGNFRVIRAEPYLMQQRVAAEPRKGRVAFAGDALHSNNPIGGLGLTSGILDAFCYGNALRRILEGKAPDSLLSSCAAGRRQAWLDVTNKLSQDNMKRLFSGEAKDIEARQGFFDKLNDKQTQPHVARAVRKSFDNMMPEDFRGIQQSSA